MKESRAAVEINRKSLHGKTPASPRAAVAFPALACVKWLTHCLSTTFSRITARRNHEDKKNAEPQTYIFKSTIHWCAILAMFCCVVATGARLLPIPMRSADEATLRSLNEKLLTAHDHRNVAVLDQIEADDFTLSGDFGTVAKQAQLDNLRKATYPVETLDRKIEPQVIRFYGDVALLTETDRAHTASGTFNYETTSVWVRSGDSWRIVQMHYSAMTDK